MQGMTLIEILVVTAIVAIIALVALPNYQDYLTRSRRADAKIGLQQLANAQERYYFERNRYADNLASINVPMLSPDGYYSLTLSSVSVISYVAHAIPVSGRSQSDDGSFKIRSSGRKSWDPDGDGVYQCSWNDHCPHSK